MIETIKESSITLPNYVFVSCYGSYFLGIFNHFADDDSKDDYMLLLSDYRLNYQALQVEQVKTSSNSSKPWFYQPINFTPAGGHSAQFGVLDNIDYYVSKQNEFLKENFDISVNDYSNMDTGLILDFIDERLNKNIYVAVAVDEYYNPNSEFYRLEHNNQGLLVTGYDAETCRYKVFNANNVNPFYLTSQQIQDGYSSQSTVKFVFVFVLDDFENHVIYNTYFRKYFKYHHNQLEFLDQFIEEYQSLTISDPYFSYKISGLSSVLLSKIVPLIHMYRHLWLKADPTLISNSITISNQFKRIADELKMCATINIDFVITKKYENHDKVGERLCKVREKLGSLSNELDKLRFLFF